MRGLHSFCDQGRCGLSEGQGGRELLRLHKEAWAQTNPTGTWEGRGRQRNGLSEADEEMVSQRLTKKWSFRGCTGKLAPLWKSRVLLPLCRSVSVVLATGLNCSAGFKFEPKQGASTHVELGIRSSLSRQFDLTSQKSEPRTLDGKEVCDPRPILGGKILLALSPTLPWSTSWQEQASSRASSKCPCSCPSLKTKRH